MTDRTLKLDRIVMHQEWYDKNHKMLFIEASVVMQELLAMCRQYKTERDEARREVCNMTAFHGLPRDYALERGWDCFEEKP